MAAQNKLEAVLSFKLDDKGLKDAEKELKQLEKQLSELQKQQASASAPGASTSKAQQTRIQQGIEGTEAAIKLRRMATEGGASPEARDLSEAFTRRVRRRNPADLTAEEFNKAFTGAIKDIFGNVNRAIKADPKAREIVDNLTAAAREAFEPRARPRRSKNPIQAQALLIDDNGMGPSRDPKAEAEAEAQAKQEAFEAAQTNKSRRGRRGVRTGPVNRDTDRYRSDVPLGPYEDFDPAVTEARGEADRPARISRADRTGSKSRATAYRYRKGVAETAAAAKVTEDFEARVQAAADTMEAVDAFEARVEAADDRAQKQSQKSKRVGLRYGGYQPKGQTYKPRGSIEPSFASATSKRRPVVKSPGRADRPPRQLYEPYDDEDKLPGPEEFLPSKYTAGIAKPSRDQVVANREVTGLLREAAKQDKETAKQTKADAEQAKIQTEYLNKIQKATDLTSSVTKDASAKHPRLIDPMAEVGRIKEAVSAQHEIIAAAKKMDDPDAIADAAKQIQQLTQAAASLKESVVGSIKPTATLSEHLGAVTKKVALINERQDLLSRIATEPDRDQRKEYAQQLNLNTKQLQSFTTAPEEKRQLTKENTARNRQYGINNDMMGSFGQFLAGNVLLMGARAARMPYTAASQAFDTFNQQHQIDPAMLSAQRSNQAAMIGMGGELQSYNLLKSAAAGAVIRSPLAPTAAVAGDLIGAIAGPAGSMMQTGASLKMAAADNPILSAILGGAGKAGLAGLAGLAGGVLGMGAFGMATGRDPFKVAQSGFFPKAAAENQTIIDMGGDISKLTLGQVEKIIPNLDQANKAIAKLDKLAQIPPDAVAKSILERSSKQFGLPESPEKVAQTAQDQQKTKEERAAATKQLYDSANAIVKITTGKEITNPDYKNNAEYLKGIISTFQKSLGQGDDASVKLVKKIIEADPTFQLQKKQLNESWKDFMVDMAHSTFKLDQGFVRQLEDISLARTRSTRDYGIQRERLGVSRTRAGEDFTIANQQNDLAIFRTRRNVTLQLTRLEEDQGKQLFRLRQDQQKERVRLEQDTAKQINRLYQSVTLSLTRTTEDATRSLQRQQEDSGRTWSRTLEDTARTTTRAIQDANKTMTRAIEDAHVTIQRSVQDYNTSGTRLMEDTGVSRQRLAEDYNVTVKQQNRSYRRSNQDLDQSYQDSVLGIVAPGLTSNPGYQLARLSRDYSKNKGRLQEDYQTGREDLNRNTERAFADLAKNLQRGIEDLNKSFARTVEDVNKSLSRTSEDVALSLARLSEDVATQIARTSEDIATQMSRATEDFATTMKRAGEDAALALSQGMEDINTNTTRTIQDLNTNLARASEDMDIEHFRTYQDALRGLQDAEIDYQTNRSEIQKNYNRTLEDLNNAEFDLKKQYNDTLTDLNTSQKRATEDYEDSRQQLALSMERFKRDFDNSVTSLAIALEQAGGAITSTTLSVLKKAITDIDTATAQGVTAVNNAAASAAASAAAKAVADAAAGNAGTGGTGGVGVSGGGASFADGANDISKDGYPAILHKGEMVVTRKEAEPLRAAGYRPESQNLKQVLPVLMRDALPQFAGGWDGTSILMPTQVQAGAYRNTQEEEEQARIWSHGTLTATPGPNGTYSFGNTQPTDPLTPYGHKVMSSGTYRPYNLYDTPDTAYLSGRTNTGGWNGQATGSQMQQSSIADPHGNNDFSDPSLRNPTFANSQTPGYGPTSPGWYGFGGFQDKNSFYAANPDWIPGTGSKWKEANNHAPPTVVQSMGIGTVSGAAGQSATSGGKHQTPTHTRTTVPVGYEDPGTVSQVMSLNTGQHAYSAALESLYGRLRGATTPQQRALLQTQGDAITAQYRSGGFNSVTGGIGTGQGLTSASTSGIISASNAIVPPSSAARSYASQVGNMSINVSISGGNGQVQEKVNQSVNAFGRDLTTRLMNVV